MVHTSCTAQAHLHAHLIVHSADAHTSCIHAHLLHVTADEMRTSWENAAEVDYLAQIDAKYQIQLAILSRDGKSMKVVRNAMVCVVRKSGLCVVTGRPQIAAMRMYTYELASASKKSS